VRLGRRRVQLRHVARELRALREEMNQAHRTGDTEREYTLLYQIARKTQKLDALLEP
jgi:hypothetical protein